MLRQSMKRMMAVCGAMLLSAAAQAQEVVKVHIPTLGFETMPFVIAEELGYYEKQKVKIERITMRVDLGVMAAVSGQVDVTQILGLSLRGAIDKGADLRIAMVFNVLPTYSLFARKPVASYQDLKGQKIGSTSSGASATKVLRVTLKDNNLDAEKDLHLFYIGDAPTIYQSLLSGAVSAAVLTSPFDVAASERSELRELPFANKPGVLMAGVAANTKFLKGRPEVAKGFMQATWEGLDYMIKERKGTVDLMVKHMKIEAATADKIYGRWIDRFTKTGMIDDKVIEQVLDFEFGKVTPDMAGKAFDFTLVKGVKKN